MLSRLIVATLLAKAALAAPNASADELRLLEADSLSMDYAKIANNREGYYLYDDRGNVSGEYWDYSVSTDFSLMLLGYGTYGFRWQNRILGEATNVQFRSVSWEFKWILDLGKKASLFYAHESRHVLDVSRDERYPLYNTYGVTINFYKREQP